MIDFEKLGWQLANSHDPQTCARMTRALRQLAADVLKAEADEWWAGYRNTVWTGEEIAEDLRTRAAEILKTGTEG